MGVLYTHFRKQELKCFEGLHPHVGHKERLKYLGFVLCWITPVFAVLFALLILSGEYLYSAYPGLFGYAFLAITLFQFATMVPLMWTFWLDNRASRTVESWEQRRAFLEEQIAREARK